MTKPRVVLIGPPGAGKTTVGRALATVLGTSFTDTDAMVEQRAGKPVSEIFIDDGEPVFRSLEHVAVHDALVGADGVLALGGGAPMTPEIADELRECLSPIVFLDVSIHSAAPRVGFNVARPLLFGNPRKQWIELMAKRRPTYEGLANFHIMTDDAKPADLARAIADILHADTIQGGAHA